LIRLHCQ